jgi:hypothetical protein
MTKLVQIYVALIGENINVWRPIQAEHLDGNLHRIVNQQYDREIESWQFKPGEVVECEIVESSNGRILAATKSIGAK